MDLRHLQIESLHTNVFLDLIHLIVKTRLDAPAQAEIPFSILMQLKCQTFNIRGGRLQGNGLNLNLHESIDKIEINIDKAPFIILFSFIRKKFSVFLYSFNKKFSTIVEKIYLFSSIDF